MNKKSIVLITVIAGLIVVGGGVAAFSNSQSEKKQQDEVAMEKTANDEAMMKKEEAEKMAMEKATMEKSGDAMSDDASMSKHGSYVSLSDYDANKSKYADSKVVYFFHASWCPICQGIDKEINADMTQIPAGVTLVKTDFDTSTDLRKKYGVTTQYTFVQVDSNGEETAQWSATSLEKAIDGIES